MKALVLIGGFGTRLRPITYTVPKQLIPLAGKPMLYHVLDLLPDDVEEVVLATGYRADAIDAYVRGHPLRWPVRTVREAEPLGTGGGMKNASGGLSDPFFLLNSDVIAAADLGGLRALQADRGGLGVMALYEVEDPRPYGVAALGPNDRISAFVEKPEPKDAPSRWINAGIAVWRREVLDPIPPGRAMSFEREVVPGLLAKGVYGFRLHEYWEDAGTPARLLHAQRLLFDAGRGGPGTLPAGAEGVGPAAANGSVRARGATFGAYVTLDNGVVVERGAHVEDSILMEGVEVGGGARVERSVLGPGVRVPAGERVVGRVLAAGGDGGTTPPGR
ncbi:MAG: sugar phosphate nucleotidyltransferase [Thermoplasmata archaeon]